MSCAMALLALGVGYLVLLQANKEKEGLKLLGQVIAILMMIGAVASSICAAKCHSKGPQCHLSAGGAPMCPVSGKMMDHETQ